MCSVFTFSFNAWTSSSYASVWHRYVSFGRTKHLRLDHCWSTNMKANHFERVTEVKHILTRVKLSVSTLLVTPPHTCSIIPFSRTANHVAASQCVKSRRYKSTAPQLNIRIISVSLSDWGMVFQSIDLMGFHTHQSSRMAQKHRVSSSSAGRNSWLIREGRKLTGRQW